MAACEMEQYDFLTYDIGLDFPIIRLGEIPSQLIVASSPVIILFAFNFLHISIHKFTNCFPEYSVVLCIDDIQQLLFNSKLIGSIKSIVRGSLDVVLLFTL